MPTIYIDDKAYEVPEDKNLLEACLNLGLDLPYFCWHPSMGSIGACRQCAVVQFQNEDDSNGRLVMGCMTPVADGGRYSLQAEKAVEFRNNVIGAMMTNHPHDCPVCSEGGECHLQDMTVMTGHRDRTFKGKKTTHFNQYLGPLVNHEMNRCITCYRCVRYYRDYAGGKDLSAQASRSRTYFGRQCDGLLESEFSGNLVEVCPTGVFTDKTQLGQFTRKWDLQSAPSICNGCGLGCNISPGERYGKLKRIVNRYHHEINGYFLCDRGRFSGGFVNSDKRLSFAGLCNGDGRYDAIGKTEALEQVKQLCGNGRKVAAIGSPRASLETNYLLRRLVGAENFAPGFSSVEQQLIGEVVRQLQNSAVTNPSLRQVESADAILILGEDVTHSAPRLALALRQSVRNKAFEMAEELKLQTWQDAAIRNLAQDARSPLFIASPAGTRLDDVAEKRLSLAPGDIVRFGVAVAAALDGSQNTVAGLDSEVQQLATETAAALKSAKNPLVISGTSCQSAAMIQVAARIANALPGDGRNPMLSYCVPESNSIGLSLLAGDSAAGFGDLAKRAAAGEIDTLIVAENDLYRRGTGAEIDALLDKVKNLVVLDAIDNRTLSRATLALPTATYIESEGTVVNSEGRAQRYYPTFIPADDRQAPWSWLAEIGVSLKKPGFDELRHFDQVVGACAAEIPALAKIVDAAPTGDHLANGFKVARQPMRYSGRTAVGAGVRLHEPKQPVDAETPLSFTMEGANGLQLVTPPALQPFVWAPGWNSNQAVSKFIDETGEPKAGPSPGVRLIDSAANYQAVEISTPDAFRARSGQWLLVALPRIFGSDELSVQAPAIAELAGEASIRLNPEDARVLDVANGDGVSIAGRDFAVQVDPALVRGCAGYPAGMAGTEDLVAGESVGLSRKGG